MAQEQNPAWLVLRPRRLRSSGAASVSVRTVVGYGTMLLMSVAVGMFVAF
jgi:hypothetical protein